MKLTLKISFVVALMALLVQLMLIPAADSVLLTVTIAVLTICWTGVVVMYDNQVSDLRATIKRKDGLLLVATIGAIGAGALAVKYKRETWDHDIPDDCCEEESCCEAEGQYSGRAKVTNLCEEIRVPQNPPPSIPPEYPSARRGMSMPSLDDNDVIMRQVKTGRF